MLTVGPQGRLSISSGKRSPGKERSCFCLFWFTCCWGPHLPNCMSLQENVLFNIFYSENFSWRNSVEGGLELLGFLLSSVPPLGRFIISICPRYLTLSQTSFWLGLYFKCNGHAHKQVPSVLKFRSLHARWGGKPHKLKCNIAHHNKTTCKHPTAHSITHSSNLSNQTGTPKGYLSLI